MNFYFIYFSKYLNYQKIHYRNIKSVGNCMEIKGYNKVFVTFIVGNLCVYLADRMA